MWNLTVLLDLVAVLKVGEQKEIAIKPSGLGGAQKSRHVTSFVMQDESASIAVTVWGDLVLKYDNLIQVCIHLRREFVGISLKSDTTRFRLETLCMSKMQCQRY